MEKLVKQSINRIFGSWKWPKNWVIKLVSLLLATSLWFLVAGEEKVDMTVQIPVEVINLPGHLEITNRVRTELDVTVTGPQALIRTLNRDVIRTIDLSKAKAGPIVIENNIDSIPMPWGVRVLRIKPAELIFNLDRLINKKLPIQAVTTGEIPKGYTLTSVMLEPSHITINGSESILKSLEGLHTKPLNINGLTKSTMTHTELDISPEIVDLIGQPAVTASIIIEEKMLHKAINNVPIIISKKDSPANLQLSANTIKIHTIIPYSVTQSTKKLNTLFAASVNTKGLQPGTHKLKVQVTVAKGIKVLEIQPDVITVTVPEPAPASDKTKSKK
jgi:YbbR domain-containing protein